MFLFHFFWQKKLKGKRFFRTFADKNK